MLEPFVFDPSLSEAWTLPASWYTEAEALALETTYVFEASWQMVGQAAWLETPGSYVATTLAEHPVLFVRDLQGELRGFYNVCKHRAGPIAEGRGSCKLLQCRYHGWTYKLDGSIHKTPEFSFSPDFTPADASLVPIQTEVWGPFLFARLAPKGPSLAEVLERIPAEVAHIPIDKMRYYRRIDYEIRCNWKVYVDNYLEGYHIPLVHPGLFKELDYQKYRVELMRYASRQDAPIRDNPASLYRRGAADPNAPAEALYFWVFPNLMLNFYPDNLQINRILPLGHERTLTIFEWYFLDPERPGMDSDFEASLAFSHKVQEEDIAICEAVQRGLKSPAYRQGRFSSLRENGVHHFHGLLCEALAASGRT